MSNRQWLALALSCALVGVTGCGGEDSSSGNEGGGSAGGAVADQEKLFEGIGYDRPPETAPKPEPGKKVWVLSCSQSITSCSTPAEETVEAAKAVGWETTLFDTRFEPGRITEGYRQAIAAGADGIIEYGLDCSISKAGLTAAVKAEVPVVAAEALPDCEEPLLTHVVTYTQGDFPTWWKEYGAAQATNVIAGTDGKAKVIVVNQADYPSMAQTLAGFEQELEKCGGCEISQKVEFTVGDIGAPLQQRVQQALVSNPDANAVYLVYDMLALGVDAAIRASGRAQSLFVAVAEGQASTTERLRSGALKGAGVGIPQGWEGYASVDALNRIFHGEEPVESGIGLQAFDPEHNFPETGRWSPPVDYEGMYAEAWGVR